MLPKDPGGGRAGCLPPSQALGQSLPQSGGSGTALGPLLPGRVKKTTVHAVQTGEDPGGAVVGPPGVGINEAMLPGSPEGTTYIPPSTGLGESGLWLRPEAPRTSNSCTEEAQAI